MSTVATSITSSATIILTDYYARYINKKPTEKQSVRALYVSNVLIGIIGIFVALAFLNVESALDAWWACPPSSAVVCWDSSCWGIFQRRRGMLTPFWE